MQQSLGLSHNASPHSNNGSKEDHGNQDTKAKGKTNLAGSHQSKIILKKSKQKKERKQTETNLQQNGSSGHSFRQIRIFAIFTIVKQFGVF